MADLNRKEAVVAWARAIAEQGYIVLDFETNDAPWHKPEAVEIALVEHRPGFEPIVLMDTLVAPVKPITPDTQAFHGISNEMVAAFSGFDAIFPEVMRHISTTNHLVIYNREFDLGVIRNSLLARGIKTLSFQPSKSRPGQLVFWTGAGIHCAMLRYSAWVGEPSRKFKGEWDYQKLPDGGHGAHRAKGDCLSTIDLVNRLAQSGEQVVQLPIPNVSSSKSSKKS